MFFNRKILVFSIMNSLYLSSNEARGDSFLSSIFTDDTFVDDKICSTVINEHPCVKNLLRVLVDHININLRRIKENELQTNLLEEKLHQNQEKLDLLQIKLANEIQKVDIFRNKLQDTSVKDKKQKFGIDKLESKQYPKSTALVNNFFLSMIHGFHQFQEIMKNNVNVEMDNSKLVRRPAYPI